MFTLSTVASKLPRSTVTLTLSPGLSVEASRIIRVRDAVPGNGVAAAQYGERAQPFDARRERAKPALHHREAASHRRLQLPVFRDQARAHRGEAMTRIELIERSPQQIVPARSPRQRLAHALA